MLTHLLRIALNRSLKPFVFTRPPVQYGIEHRKFEFSSNKIGIYIHIPFCRKICDFCPYNKMLYSRSNMERFIEGLITEIHMYAPGLPEDAEIPSIYFGGGTPSTAVHHIHRILEALRDHIVLPWKIAVELHPDDINKTVLDALKQAGVSMVSLGVQSFSPKCLQAIGREPIELEKKFALMEKYNFSVVDVDLIFSIPGQDEHSLENDFRKAVELGASQISTYPFIAFSYTGKKYRQPKPWTQRKLLDSLIETAEKLYFERTSIWTFAKKGSSRYSSITRDNVLGFGPSATSLLKDKFTINSFSLDEYLGSIRSGESPRALELNFKARTRMLYWLFWNSYNLTISSEAFEQMFKLSIVAVFGRELKAARFLGLVQKQGLDYLLTRRGALLFHRVEQLYTHQYIDKTWKICSASARPERIVLY